MPTLFLILYNPRLVKKVYKPKSLFRAMRLQNTKKLAIERIKALFKQAEAAFARWKERQKRRKERAARAKRIQDNIERMHEYVFSGFEIP